MPRSQLSRNELAKKLVQIDKNVETYIESVKIQRDLLEITELTLGNKATTLAATHQQYQQGNVYVDTPAPQAVPEVRPNWFVRMIDKRIEAKLQRTVDAEIDRLIKLRNEKKPNSTELDFVFIRESVKRAHEQIKGAFQDNIHPLRQSVVFLSSVSTLCMIGGVVAAIFTGPFSIPLFVVGVATGVLAAVDARRLIRTIPNEHASALAKYISDVKHFAGSSETFDNRVEKHLNDAKDMLPAHRQQLDRAPVATVSLHHKHKHKHHHSVAKQSMFAGSDDGMKTPTEHHSHRRHASLR